MEESVCRVAIVDDDPVARCALHLLVEHGGRHRVVGTYSNGAAALRNLAGDPPEIVLLDQRTRGRGGLTCLRQIQQRRLRISVIMVTTSSEPALVRDCLHAGARGYLLKPPSLEHVTLAIAAALLGGIYLDQRPQQHVEIDAQSQPDGSQLSLPHLGPRESELLQALRRGLTARQAAAQFSISENTVKTHIRRVYVRLGVNCRMQALTKAGLLPPA